MNSLLLSLVIGIPFLAVTGIIATRRSPNTREAISLLAGALLFFTVCLVYQRALAGAMIEIQVLAILPGLELAFKAEPLGILFSLVASFLWFVTTLYAIGYLRAHQEKNQTRFYSLFAIAIGATMAIAYAENLFTLFIAYEALTLCTYPLVTHSGTDEARRRGRIYLGVLLATSLGFFLPAIITTWNMADTLSFTAGGIFPAHSSPLALSVVLLFYLLGIGKAAVMPLHHWLPAAMVAPTPVSALLHAVAVVKAGVFTLLKICVFIFGFDTLQTIPLTQYLLYVIMVSILLAALIALRQDNLKRRLAFSTISQLGYISLGAMLATSASATGAALHIAVHAFGKITLFFCAGILLITTNKTRVAELSGIGRSMPLTMTAFFIASLCIIGLPPTGGTWSKWYLLLGTLDAGQQALMALLAGGSLLSLAYLLPIPVRAFFSPPHASGEDKKATSHSASRQRALEAPLPTLLAIGITTLGCVALFIYPEFIFHLAVIFSQAFVS